MQLARYKKIGVNQMGEKTIQSIPVMPFAMMLGIISAVIGLIIGIIYALVFGAIISAVPATTATTGVVNFGWLAFYLVWEQ